jgi:hypothetical protein
MRKLIVIPTLAILATATIGQSFSATAAPARPNAVEQTKRPPVPTEAQRDAQLRRAIAGRIKSMSPAEKAEAFQRLGSMVFKDISPYDLGNALGDRAIAKELNSLYPTSVPADTKAARKPNWPKFWYHVAAALTALLE